MRSRFRCLRLSRTQAPRENRQRRAPESWLSYALEISKLLQRHDEIMEANLHKIHYFSTNSQNPNLYYSFTPHILFTNHKYNRITHVPNDKISKYTKPQPLVARLLGIRYHLGLIQPFICVQQ